MAIMARDGLTDDREVAPCIHTPHMPQQLNPIHIWHHHILKTRNIPHKCVPVIVNLHHNQQLNKGDLS